MTGKRTDRSRYKSPSTGDYCTAAQYIAEMMCQRMAENSNEGSLAYKFWNTDKWKKTYTHQIILANRLVEDYDERAVIKALKSSRGCKIYSLRFPSLVDLIKSEEDILNRLDAFEEQVIQLPDSNDVKTPQKPFGKRSKINKLRDLDV
jgi:hypothetical protein